MKVLVIFLMVAVGFLANKKRYIPEGSDSVMIPLLLGICSPCLILYSMANCELTSALYMDVVVVLLGSACCLALTVFICFFIAKALKYNPVEDTGALLVIMTCMNSGFMGLPVTQAIFGNYMLFLMVIQNVILNIDIYVVVPVQLRLGERKKSEGPSALHRLLNINTVAVFVGLIILFCGVELPSPALEFLDYIGSATIPLSMLVVGYQLAERKVMTVLTNRKLVISSFVKMLLVPLITFLAVNWLPFSVHAKALLIFASCFPTAVVPASLAQRIEKNGTLISEGVALTTAMSMATLPLAAWFLSMWYGI